MVVIIMFIVSFALGFTCSELRGDIQKSRRTRVDADRYTELERERNARERLLIEQNRALVTNNRRLEEHLTDARRISEGIGELSNRSVRDLREAIVLLRDIRTEIKALENGLRLGDSD